MSRADRLLHLEVVTPARQVLEADVEAVILPALDGYVGILPGHAPMIVGLDIGLVHYGGQSGPKQVMAVAGGFAEVRDDQVKVLADTAELAREIDVPRAKAAFARAEERLRHPSRDLDLARAEAALRRAAVRLEVAGRAGGGGGAREGGYAPGEERLGEP
ncbi:MAG: F0F1 ATP synthase subunit epsilon [Limnochordaceae bacterium]|nr:F0F1 ATP synthase subunit epsilon [Limnochordaceae bacterium]